MLAFLEAMKMRLPEFDKVVTEARTDEDMTKGKVTDLRYTLIQFKDANIDCDCTEIKDELEKAETLYHSQILASRDAEGKVAQKRDDIKVLEAYILATETATHVREVPCDSLRLYMTAKMPEDEQKAHGMAEFLRCDTRDPSQYKKYYDMYLSRMRDETKVSLKMFISMTNVAAEATNELNATKQLLAKEVAKHAITKDRLSQADEINAGHLCEPANKKPRLG
jgi:hypothetical protein